MNEANKRFLVNWIFVPVFLLLSFLFVFLFSMWINTDFYSSIFLALVAQGLAIPFSVTYRKELFKKNYNFFKKEFIKRIITPIIFIILFFILGIIFLEESESFTFMTILLLVAGYLSYEIMKLILKKLDLIK